VAEGRGVGVDVGGARGLGALPQHGIGPQFLVVEEGQVALGDAEGVRAGGAGGGQQRGVADRTWMRPRPEPGIRSAGRALSDVATG